MTEALADPHPLLLAVGADPQIANMHSRILPCTDSGVNTISVSGWLRCCQGEMARARVRHVKEETGEHLVVEKGEPILWGCDGFASVV